MTDQARDIIRRAADLVEQGWCQHKYTEIRDGKTCYCVQGALIDASRDATYEDERDADLAVYGHVGNSIIDYNDAPNRTQAEVVAMLREVAES